MGRPWVLLFIVALGSTGCGEASRLATASSKPVVALVVKTLTNPFFGSMEQGARRAEREWGFKLLVKSAAEETSIEQQIAIIETLTDEGVAAIVVAPGSSTDLVPVLKRAQDRGVILVNLDNRIDASMAARGGLKGVPFVGVDNERGGYLAAQALVAGVSRPTEAAFLEGIRQATNSGDRKRGAERAFAENSLVKVVDSRTAHWKIDEAYEVTRQMFQDHPSIRLLFAANDMMALGAVQFLQEAGLTQVRVSGYDALDAVQRAIAAGRVAASVDQQADVQGYVGCVTAFQLLAGQTVPPEVLVPVRLVTRANLGP